jgi:hypothetical protein
MPPKYRPVLRQKHHAGASIGRFADTLRGALHVD